VHDIIGHRCIDFTGQFNEPCPEFVFPGFPGQVKRIDRNTVATQPRTGIEGLEAERFCFGGFDDLPDVDVHPVEKHLEFVDESDVDRTVDVLQKLCCFGNPRRGDGNGPLDNLIIKGFGRPEASFRVTAHYFGNRADAEIPVVRILPFGRKGQVEIHARRKAGRFQNFPHVAVRCSRIGG